MSLFPYYDFDVFGHSAMNNAMDRFQRDMRRFERDVLSEMDAMTRLRGPPTGALDEHSATGFREGMVTKEGTDEQGRRTLDMCFDVRQYKPEEIRVTADGRTLRVDAKHDEEWEDGKVHKEFHRGFTLPDNVDMEEMKSALSGGVLSVRVPLKTPEEEASGQPTVITIQYLDK